MIPRIFRTGLFGFAICAFSATIQASGVCRNVPENNRYVVRLSTTHVVKLCAIASYQEAGADCDLSDGDNTYLPNLVWEDIVDLNIDGNYDLILSNTPNGYWRGVKIYAIFVSCGDNTYINVSSYFNYGSLRVRSGNAHNGWRQLEAVSDLAQDGENENAEARYVLLEFDPKKLKYIRKYVGDINSGLSIQDERRAAPADFDIKWDEFPASIPRKFAPSFDCAKASNQTEKIICAYGDLSRLDVAFAVRLQKAIDRLVMIYREERIRIAVTIGISGAEGDGTQSVENLIGVALAGRRLFNQRFPEQATKL